MMRKRLIPVLLVDQKRRLVKTIEFGERTYVGDPFNVVRLFNEKEVDEICILDIDATRTGRGPDLGFVRELATECFMPLAYGGGITELKQCEELNRSGVEKFVLGQGARNSQLVGAIAADMGSQALVACVDVDGRGAAASCYASSGARQEPIEFCLRLQDAGVGEIILQSKTLDGTRNGYDLELIQSITRKLSIPVVALGGAGNVAHLMEGLHAGASAAASGSAFTFIGRLRAVLISYPAPEILEEAEQGAHG
ncbi:imidazole glycerol phosphate synthase subunit HisF [Rhizobium leguminosarum]|nr:imidazole glycerol phosphate synthase subunit HisF [Rhizobium leguminosarum]MBY5318617.1 imidazole glycerol phosphate synthase subunit HisF [Rhizobium leguminosarum]NEH53634.1 imidazole glycerol phosphate synthase subunit HisF [Rhizobium leguminosarum]